jgi:hypothetical protein
MRRAYEISLQLFCTAPFPSLAEVEKAIANRKGMESTDNVQDMFTKNIFWSDSWEARTVDFQAWEDAIPQLDDFFVEAFVDQKIINGMFNSHAKPYKAAFAKYATKCQGFLATIDTSESTTAQPAARWRYLLYMQEGGATAGLALFTPSLANHAYKTLNAAEPALKEVSVSVN